MAKPTFKAKTRSSFRDLRDFISLLEETGNLHRVSARIEKDRELMPLVRWQYQGLPDSQRKAFFLRERNRSPRKELRLPRCSWGARRFTRGLQDGPWLGRKQRAG
jgi:hypothetical protein